MATPGADISSSHRPALRSLVTLLMGGLMHPDWPQLHTCCPWCLRSGRAVGMLRSCSRLLSCGSPLNTQIRGTVIVERWWQVHLAKEGKEAYVNQRKHRIYRVLEDTKHGTKDKIELILTQNVPGLGSYGDTVLVEKRVGRNKLLPQGMAVYASPENKERFEEEKGLQLEGKIGGRRQTWTGEQIVKYLNKSRLEIEMKDDITWQLNEEIVARNLLKKIGVVAPVTALKIPDEPITEFGKYWCEVTVNGIDTVRIPMDVVTYTTIGKKRYLYWLAKEAERAKSREGGVTSKPPPEGDIASEFPAAGGTTTELPSEGDIASKLPPEDGAPPKSSTN